MQIGLQTDHVLLRVGGSSATERDHQSWLGVERVQRHIVPGPQLVERLEVPVERGDRHTGPIGRAVIDHPGDDLRRTLPLRCPRRRQRGVG